MIVFSTIGIKPVKGRQISYPMLLEQYVAVADYKKDARNEIELHSGQLVEVVEKCDTGKNGGRGANTFFQCIFITCCIILIFGGWVGSSWWE